MKKCNIVYVGKNRNGTDRYWCTTHHAPASNGKGEKFHTCLAQSNPAADVPQDSLTVNLEDESNGIALWAYVPAVYDTAKTDSALGIRVQTGNGTDKFCHLLQITNEDQQVSFNYTAAVSYLASNILNQKTAYLECTHCGFPHLDKDWFAANPHKKHLCSGCGRNFYEKRAEIGNPIIKANALLSEFHFPANSVMATRKLSIKQKDFPLGISIWGFNPAIFCTGPETETEGIHVHAYTQDNSRPVIDATYSEVEIDGICLNANMVQLYMAQKTLPYLKDRIASVKCPDCGTDLFETGRQSYLPATQHVCPKCGKEIKNRRKIVASPMPAIIERLKGKTSLPLSGQDILDVCPQLSGW